jgi:hypothetical protein
MIHEEHCEERFEHRARNVRTIKSARSIDCDRVAGVAEFMWSNSSVYTHAVRQVIGRIESKKVLFGLIVL